MYKTGLVILLLQGLPQLSLGFSGKYFYVPLTKTWTEAQSYCRENSLDLATIENEDDWNEIKELLVNENAAYIWVGLYDDVKSWRWSLDDTYLFRDGVNGFGDWQVFVEENDLGREHCAALMLGQVLDISCLNRRYPLCYDEHTVTYTEGPSLMPWSQAQTYCRQHHTDLASIRDKQEQDRIASVTRDTAIYWTGLYRDSWKWSDQSNFEFTAWESGEPGNQEGNENCGRVTLGGWSDARCHEEFPFICSVSRNTLLKVVLKPEGSIDLTDPSVSQAVLKAMERKMSEHGLNRHLKLTWRSQPNGEIFTRNANGFTSIAVNNTV